MNNRRTRGSAPPSDNSRDLIRVLRLGLVRTKTPRAEALTGWS